MKAPDKIYMTPSYGEPDNVLLASFSKSHLDCHRDIEYVRKDSLWKPSEEQMNVLGRFLKFLHESGSPDFGLMDSLLGQLKKL